MKIISMVRAICLIPIFFIYGAWMLFRLTLRVAFLVVAIWLIHSLFGMIGDIVLALPIIYCLSFLLPNPHIANFGKILKPKKYLDRDKSSLPHTKIVDFKAYQRGAKP